MFSILDSLFLLKHLIFRSCPVFPYLAPAMASLLPLLLAMWLSMQLAQPRNTKCGKDRNIRIGNVVGVQDGDLVTFSCTTGYHLRGETELSCKKGTLMGKLPRCVKEHRARGEGIAKGGRNGGNNKNYRLIRKMNLGSFDKQLLKYGGKQDKDGEKPGTQKRKGKKKYLKSMKDLMMGDQPTGLGIPYGNDVVGHQDQLVLLDDYNDIEDVRYDLGYDRTDYDYKEEYDYEGEYEEETDTDYNDDNEYEKGACSDTNDEYEDYEEYEYDREE